MNPRLLTSAVAIHATACMVAIFAVGPRQADASFDFLKIDSHQHSIPENDRSLEPSHSRYQHIQKIAASDLDPQTVVNPVDQEWDEAKFDAQLEATSDFEIDAASGSSLGGEVVIAAPVTH